MSTSNINEKIVFDTEFNSIINTSKHLVRSVFQKVNREGVGFLETEIEKLSKKFSILLLTTKRDICISYHLDVELINKYNRMIQFLNLDEEIERSKYQITDLTLKTKVELGDGVIQEIKKIRERTK